MNAAPAGTPGSTTSSRSAGRRARLVLLILALGGLAPAGASEEAAPRRESVEYVMGEDRIVAAERARAGGAVSGDLLLAGGEVLVLNPVGGDLLAAGGDVLIDAAASQDVYTAGGRVTLNADVTHNLRAAGGKLEIARQARVGGNATLAGGRVLVLGAVQGHLAVVGGHVYLNGPVGGNVDAAGGEIELGPDARIGGELRYRSPEELTRSPGAEVLGGIQRQAVGAIWTQGPQGQQGPQPARTGLWVLGAGLLVWMLGLMLVAALVVVGLPGLAGGMANTARARPGFCVLLGFIVLVGVPVAALLLMVTGIGFPLALLALVLYPAVLMLGLVAAGIALGDIGLRRLSPVAATRPRRRALAAALAIPVIGLVGVIPLLGWLLCLVVWLGGVGALLSSLRSLTVKKADEVAVLLS